MEGAAGDRPIAVAVIVAFVVVPQWVKPASPRHVVIAAGCSDGDYYRYPEIYRERFAKEGITLEVRETSGSIENIHLLGPARADGAH